MSFSSIGCVGGAPARGHSANGTALRNSTSKGQRKLVQISQVGAGKSVDLLQGMCVCSTYVTCFTPRC
jgi:hypothetical protein